MSVIWATTRPRYMFFANRLASKSSLVPLVPRHSLLSRSARYSQLGPPTDWFTHTCDIDAEPLHCYRKGGYHPVHLEDRLSNGRYKILHKLGWGGYSTVWTARDTRDQTYVALKISVSEPNRQNREATVMRTIAAAHSDQPGYQYLMTMRDSFQIVGPNGIHECLVLELLGPSVADYLDAHVERLPGTLAKTIVKQALLALCFLHERGIAHADLHTRNLAFKLPSLDTLRQEDLLRKLGPPETGAIRRNDGQSIGPDVPRYLVRPTSYPVDINSSSNSIKIVDFGESFLSNECPSTLNTPLPLRSPEIIFKDKVDYRVDLWSMGCLIFELVAGQPPFDGIMTKPAIIVRQMLESVSDDLPARWETDWKAMREAPADNSSACSLQEWLEEVYFDGERRQDMSKKDILRVGALIGSLLRMEPSARASAKSVVQDAWLQEK